MWNLGPEHERRLKDFLDALRNDPNWTEAQVRELETAVRTQLDVIGGDGNGDGTTCNRFPTNSH